MSSSTPPTTLSTTPNHAPDSASFAGALLAQPAIRAGLVLWVLTFVAAGLFAAWVSSTSATTRPDGTPLIKLTPYQSGVGAGVLLLGLIAMTCMVSGAWRASRPSPRP